MKWMAEWWGIQIIAETDDDEELLRKLKSKLSDSAYKYYEDGNLVETKELMFPNSDIEVKYSLEFSR